LCVVFFVTDMSAALSTNSSGFSLNACVPQAYPNVIWNATHGVQHRLIE